MNQQLRAMLEGGSAQVLLAIPAWSTAVTSNSLNVDNRHKNCIETRIPMPEASLSHKNTKAAAPHLLGGCGGEGGHSGVLRWTA